MNDQSLGLVASAGVDETRGWSLRRNRSRSSSEVERADGSADLGRERVNGSVVHAAVWLADHYEVAAFYHAVNHEFLGPLEEALRQVLGVYQTTQIWGFAAATLGTPMQWSPIPTGPQPAEPPAAVAVICARRSSPS